MFTYEQFGFLYVLPILFEQIQTPMLFWYILVVVLVLIAYGLGPQSMELLEDGRTLMVGPSGRKLNHWNCVLERSSGNFLFPFISEAEP